MRRTNVVGLILLVPALAGFGWVASEDARAGYLQTEPRIAVRPVENGWATIADTAVRLESVEQLDGVEDYDGTQWEPPPGYTIWRVAIEVQSKMREERQCYPAVRDAAGREYTPPDFGVGMPGPSWPSLSCGAPGDDPTLATTFLLPAGSRPVVLDLTNSGTPDALAPEYFSLPLR